MGYRPVVKNSNLFFIVLGPSEVTFFQGKNSQWLDYLQSPALLVAGSSRFCAVGMDDGSVNVYTHTGRR